MKYIFFLSLIFCTIQLYAQESGSDLIKIQEYYKTASPEEKQYIDSVLSSLDAEQKKEQVTNIAGIPFGASKNQALKILTNKYGDPDVMTSSVSSLSYRNIRYANNSFDSALFIFQSDGDNSFLSSCIFANNAKDLNQAQNIQNELKEILSKKYNLIEILDSNGFKIYAGGISPLWNGRWQDLEIEFFNAVHIDIIEYDANVIEYFGYKYAVRIIYGPYNYIDEDF